MGLVLQLIIRIRFIGQPTLGYICIQRIIFNHIFGLQFAAIVIAKMFKYAVVIKPYHAMGVIIAIKM